MTSMHSALSGTLTIGIIDTLITDRNMPLPELLRAYKRKHPQVEFNIETKPSNLVEQAVIDGTLEAGLVIGRRHIQQLDYKLLYQEPHNLYCSDEHPLFHRDPATLTIEEVCKYEYASYSFASSATDAAERSGPARQLNTSACVDSVEAMAILVSSGCFLAMLPDHYVQSVWRLRHFKPILPHLFSVSNDIELATRHGTPSPLVMALLDVVDELGSVPLQSRPGVTAARERSDKGRPPPPPGCSNRDTHETETFASRPAARRRRHRHCRRSRHRASFARRNAACAYPPSAAISSGCSPNTFILYLPKPAASRSSPSNKARARNSCSS